jgi:hypothetical protein
MMERAPGPGITFDAAKVERLAEFLGITLLEGEAGVLAPDIQVAYRLAERFRRKLDVPDGPEPYIGFEP